MGASGLLTPVLFSPPKAQRRGLFPDVEYRGLNYATHTVCWMLRWPR